MRYHQWRERFSELLLAPDMPLMTPVPGEFVEKLLRGFCKAGVSPRKAADLFNLRFQVAVMRQEEGEDGEEGTVDAGTEGPAPSEA